MAEPPEPYVPRRSPSAPKARIKPAGWVIIVLALGALAYFAWSGSNSASKDETPPAAPTAPSAPTAPKSTPTSPVASTAPKPGLVLASTLFPQPALSLPAANRAALANVVLPPLSALETPPAGARSAPSELEAVRAVARGEADATIISVAAFAAAPEAIAAGVKATWFVGTSPNDAALFPSCDGAQLAQLKLGAVPGSLGEFELLAALAGQPLPSFVTFEREADLTRAIGERTVTGGPASGPAHRACVPLPPEASSLVVVRDTRKPMSAESLAALVSLARAPAPTPAEVAAFFDPHRHAPGGFDELFTSAGDVWSAVGLITTPAKIKAAIDSTFIAPGTPLVATTPEKPEKTGARATMKELGFPSWPDR